jgi:putative ABC transport system permease protein
MLKNYILTAFRSFKRHKTYAILNIFGLAVGIGCAYVLFSVIDYHNAFDKHLSNYDRIYRIVDKDIYPDSESYGMGTPHPVAEALRNDYPELKAVTRVHYAYGDQVNVYQPDGTIEKYSVDNGVTYAEPEFFEIFDVNWVAGSKETALTRPNTVVLSLSQIEKFFDLDEKTADKAIGKIINIANQQDLEIVGVVEDPVEQTNFPFTVYIEYETQKSTNPYYDGGTRWNSTSSGTNTYILVGDNFDREAFDATLDDFIDKNKGEGTSETEKFMTQELGEIHYDERFGAYGPMISKQLLYSLGVIALFLIVTASINFINLSTAQAANRAKEIGIRKAIGGYIGQLRLQFMAEIAVITGLALLLSLAVSELMFILLEDLLGYRLSIDLIEHPYKLLVLFGLFVVVSLLSGLYPSFLLSKMNTVVALKSKINVNQHSGGFNLRKGLVILQFAISQLLIIGTIVIKLQADYFLGKDVGFEKDAIISTFLPERDEQKLERFRNEMLASPVISDISMSLAEPTGNSDSWSNINYAPLASETDYHANFKACDDRFIDFWGIDLIAGRFIKPSDSTKNVVVNRKIADLMGFKDQYDAVIGETIETGWNGDKKIVGVSENFHVDKLTEELPYVVMIHAPFAWYNASFKISAGGDPTAALDHYRSVWESVFPEYVSSYSFYDKSYAERYQYEVNTSKLLMIFSIISILIGCLGLYGLISFMAINKTKEIGVRKVLGASVWSILSIFSIETLLLIGLAFVVAAPIAYFILNALLDEIPYRIDLNVSYFLLGLIGTMLIAFLTISHRTIASARINPAATLKDE